MRAIPIALLVVLSVAACSTSSATPDGGAASCPDVGRACTRDDECCTKYCQVLGGGAFCVVKPATEPPCGGTGASCTQARHCCSRKCTSNSCDPELPPPPPPPCKSAGQACADSSECCVGTCNDDAIVGRRCGSATPDGGGFDAGDAAVDAVSD